MNNPGEPTTYNPVRPIGDLLCGVWPCALAGATTHMHGPYGLADGELPAGRSVIFVIASEETP